MNEIREIKTFDFREHSNYNRIMATAYLSNENNWTIFSFEEYRIRFATSRHLEKYTQIKSWNNGYIIVMAKYDNAKDAEEDYIDLIPILENLYIPKDEFLKNISEVKIQNERIQ